MTGGLMHRLQRSAVERLMDGRPDATLEAALEVFEVFASGSLTDEVYILEDVGSKRIAVAPMALRDKFRRGGAMAIVYISHQMGAGGPEIGMALAQRVGYPYVNQELLLDAARRYGLAEDRLSHLDESKPTLFERFDTETRHHITVLQTTCLEFAEDDNAVLMRGGGQWLLRGVPHVLRVRIIAPFEHRVKQWIKRTAEMTGETPNQRAAADLVRRDDIEKSGRMRYLYEVDVADPTLYELVVNTEKLK